MRFSGEDCAALLGTMESVQYPHKASLDDILEAITQFVGIMNSYLDNMDLPDETENFKLFVSEISEYLVR